MGFTLDDIVIDRVQYGFAEDLDGNPLYTLTQLQDATINISAESTDATDNQGNLIKRFWKAKTGEFTANNAMINLNVIGAASGEGKRRLQEHGAASHVGSLHPVRREDAPAASVASHGGNDGVELAVGPYCADGRQAEGEGGHRSSSAEGGAGGLGGGRSHEGRRVLMRAASHLREEGDSERGAERVQEALGDGPRSRLDNDGDALLHDHRKAIRSRGDGSDDSA